MKDDFSYSFSFSFFQLINEYRPEEKKLIGDELDGIAQSFNNNKKIYQFFSHPNIHFLIKKNLIEKIIENEILKRMIVLLIRVKKINLLQKISQFYNVFLNMKADYVNAELQMPWEVKPSLLNEIRNSLENYFDKKVNITVVENPEIVGGLYIKIQNVILDYTINRVLETFAERFKSENR